MKKTATPLFISLVIVVVMMAGWHIPSAFAEGEQPVSIVVKLKAGLSPAEHAAVIAHDGGVVTTSIPALRMYVLSIPPGEDAYLVLQNFQQDPQVERAELNRERRAEALPNDPSYAVQWAMPKIGWDNIFGSVVPSGTATVAVLDTGVYANHPDLGENVVLTGRSMLDINANGWSDPNGHGTWLAGVIGAVTDNGSGIAGICTGGVKILPVTVLDANGIGKDGDIIAGIIWAVDQGADVILMGFSNTDFSQNLQDAIDYAWENGAVIVAAAGNAGIDTPTFPAGNRGVVGVSATSQDDLLTANSNYGQTVFIAAPGENIYTTNSSDQDPYTYISGTSASSAVVAGVAAFLKAVDPTLDNGVIVGRLATSADAVGIAGDPNNEAMFGNGRINMASALASTSTVFIQPAGAAPIGGGGPYLGPYTTASEFDVDASFSARTSTISSHGEGFVSTWTYQYAYKSPSGAITYNPCKSLPVAASDQLVLPSGFETGTWKVYLHAYNPSYATCLNNGSATRTATTTTYVNVTPAYMTVAPATGTYGSTATLSATLTIGTPLSGKTITFTINGNVAGTAVTDGSGVATLFNASLGTVNAGTYPLGIGASFAGDGTYLASSGVGSLTVDRATPAVTAWPTASPISYGESLSASILSGGSASVSGSFSFTAPGTMPNAGNYSAAVTFTPSNANFNPVSGTINVVVGQAAAPSVTAWPTASPITYGQPLSESALSGGSASVPGSFSFAVPTTVPNAGVYGAAVTFTPTDPNYSTVSGVVDLTVNMATPVVTAWPMATAITYGQALSASTLSGGSASVAGSFSFAVPATLPNAGSYNAALLFTPSNPNYGIVSGSVDLTVNKATPVVMAWPTATAITYGQALSASAISGGSASVAGSFSFAVPATVPDAGIYSAALLFTPNDPNYGIVSGSVDLTVNRATPVVTAWPSATAITYGQALSASTLSGGSASVAGGFSFAVPASVPNAGNYSAAVSFTPTDPNYSTVSGVVYLTVNMATPVVTAWPMASTIIFGQPLSAATLTGGSASTAGIFTFDAPTAVLNAGTHAVPVTFIPGDSSNYINASGSVNIIVSPAYQQINFGSLPSMNFGVVPFTVNATATSGLPVSFNSLTSAVCTVSGDTVTVIGVGTCTIEASQPGSLNYYPASPVSQSFIVNPGELDHFSISSVSSPQIAGTPFSITITALDAWNHTVTSFNGTVDLTTTAGRIIPAVSAPFLDGVWTGTVLVTDSGIGRITATANAFTFSGNTFDVNPGVAVAFTVTAPPITSAGVPFDVTVTAKDAYDNIASGYTGIVQFTSSDTKAGIHLPGEYTFLAGDSGIHIFSGIILESAGTQTITATDIASSSINGTSGSIAVNPAEAAKLSITAPASATAGTPFNVTVSVKDAYENNISGYTGTVMFTSSDLQGVLPVNYTFVAEDNGSHTFVSVVSLKTSGSQTITATDLSAPGVAGTSGSIAISPAAPGVLAFSQQPVNSAPGLPIAPAVAVSLIDQYGNLVTGSTAEVTLSLASGSHSGTLAGTLTRSAVNGIVTFDDLTLLPEGNGYMLTATSGVLPPVNSDSFDILAGNCGNPASITVPAASSTASATITWSASDVSGATYILEQSRDGGAFTVVYIGTDVSANITFTASGSYRYRVKAMKDGYASSDYTVGSNGCVVSLICPAPAMLTVPTANSTGSIYVTWSASSLSGVTYILEQKKDGGVFTQVYSGDSIYANITVTADGSYSYRVKAEKNGYIASAYTDGSNGCGVQLVCGKPAFLMVPALNSTGSIPIYWSPSDVNGATYILEQSSDGVTFTQVYSGTNTTAYINVPDNGLYRYRVKAQKTNYVTSGYTDGSNACTVRLVCGKPESLSVPAANNTGILYISWAASDVNGATYILEQSTENGPYLPVYTGTRTYVNITVTANGTYSYRVKAQKESYDPSDYTNGSNGCAVHLACGKPDTLTVPSANSTGLFFVTWSASDVSGATYILEQSNDGITYTPVYTGTNIYANISVAANGTYSYRVKALKTNYDTSDYTVGTNGCAVHLACGKPVSITVPAANSTGVLSITWGASDVIGANYILEQKKDNGEFIQVYSGTNMFTNIAVTANGIYSYRVKAQKTNYDTSAYADSSNGCAVHLACGMPASLTIPPVNSTGVLSITWGASDVSGATYVLEQSRDGSAFTEVYRGTSSVANITVTDHGTYNYRIKAEKANYDTSDYTPGSNGCLVRLACGKPETLTVPASNSSGTIQITWSASDVSGATYILEQSLAGGPFTQVYSGSNTMVFIPVAANGTYTYRVKAIKTNYDPSYYTAGSNGCVVYLVCGKPASLTVPAANSTGTLFITWGASDVNGATYVLEQSIDGLNFSQVYSGTNMFASVTVPAHGTYTYRVKAQKTNYDESGYTAGNTAALVRLACGKPASLNVPESSFTGNLLITWSSSDVNGATYLLEQSSDGVNFTQVYSGTGNFANINIAANGTYSYRVMAQKAGYDASGWTTGATGCTVSVYSKVKITVTGQQSLYFSTISAAFSGVPFGSSAVLNSWQTTIVENVDFNKPDTTLTIGSAFNESYTNPAGPTVVLGVVKVTAGTLVIDNLEIR